MIQTLITMRHSVTAHNLTRVITGRLDEPLCDEGRALARASMRVHVDVVVSSPSRRALETAAITTGRGPDEILISPLCWERSYGALEALNSDQVARYRDQIRYLVAGGIAHSLNPPGGETFDQVHDRALRFATFVRDLPAESVLVVSHEAFLQQLHRALLGLDLLRSLARSIRPLQTHHFQHRPRDHWQLHADRGSPGIAAWQPW